MFRIIFIVTATAVFTASAVAGGARGVDWLPVIEGNVDVAYNDLDLNWPQDAAIMLGRIETAAKHACGGMPERDRFYRSSPKFVSKQFRQCTQDAVRGAVMHLAAPQVSRVYAKKRGVAATDIAQH